MKNANRKPVVIVIGGGPAGLMAAGTSASLGADVILLEKNKSCGKKLLLTGSGKCNITNSAPLDIFLEHFAENKKFLYPSFKALFINELELFFNRYQIFFQIEENGKIFPTVKKSSSVLLALLSFCSENRVDLHLEEAVISIERNNNNNNNCNDINNNASTIPEKFSLAQSDVSCHMKDINLPTANNVDYKTRHWTVTTSKGQYTADSVIIATGGLSYPQTGSNGDGYKLAMKCSHTIVPTRPALVPLEIAKFWGSTLSGVSLKDVTVSLWEHLSDSSAKKITSQKGDLLFTHFGLSGPVILFISRWLPYENENDFKSNEFYIEIDILPSKSRDEIEGILLNSFKDSPTRHVRTVLNKEFEIPLSVANAIVLHCGFHENHTGQDVTKDKRKLLLSALKSLQFSITKTRGYKEAMVTAGGVSTKEIRPQTMESKLNPGLYFAGEVLDIDGYTGGFNLQGAFSTGYLAGKNAAKLGLAE